MAIMKPTPQDQRELNLNPKIKLPKERYGLRIKNEEFKIASTGNPMIELTFEFLSPDSFVGPDGETVNIAGVELNQKQRLVLQVKDPETGQPDVEKSQKAFDRYSDLLKKLGVEIPEEGIDTENPPKLLKGKLVDAICDAEESAQRKDPTPEQKAKKQAGDVIKGPDGKEIIAYFTKVVDILGPADESIAAGRPF